MAKTFGELLREHRVKAGKTMGDLADHLRVSITYVSDVERGNRAPLTPDNLARAIALLGIEPPAADALYLAAAQNRGAFELATNVSAKAREVGAALMRGWPDLSDEDLEMIRKIVDGPGHDGRTERGGK